MDDAATPTLITAGQLARETPIRWPGESADYRAARTALLAEEIELRRHAERVARLRRALPPGPVVRGDYLFDTEDGRKDLAGLFGDKQTLVAYSYMFGPQRERPCPMCTNQLAGWAGNAADLAQKLSLVVIARSPLARLLAWKGERGWSDMRLVSDLTGAYSRDYFGVLPNGEEIPALNVFSRRDGVVRHFWAGEFTGASADPGEDPRGTTPAPLWQILDHTPEGRPPGWRPSLSY